MKIVLATGIYPPAVGGPSTYVRKLAEQLTERGDEVTVLTYGTAAVLPSQQWKVATIPKNGGPLLRWFRFAELLRQEASNADIVYAFSSVSVGMPLWLSRLKKPKRILRLGGDFLWERYTDWRGQKTLREWYASHPSLRPIYHKLLQSFHHIVFSTAFQERLYQRTYRHLPSHSVIENALPPAAMELHAAHQPFRLLFLGRFVRFKNLRVLLRAVARLPHVTLTLAGEGPLAKELSQLALTLNLRGRVTFIPTVAGEEKERLLKEHDLMILPSITEISPHAALEARACGLPVLLSEETGLSEDLRAGMTLSRLRTVDEVTRAILEAEQLYPQIAAEAASPLRERSWDAIANESQQLFQKLLS